MKNIILLVICLAFLSGCMEEGIKVESTTNVKVPITVLFEYDGVRVYRFFDGEFHYFARVIGTEKVRTMSDYTESTGKTTTTYHDSIETVR